MPSRVEFLYVPLQARMVCYQCGTHVPEDADKDNCPLCFEVFCLKCMVTNQKRSLPASYGYTGPQSVCVSCDSLLSSFVLLTSLIDSGGAGVLLPPRHAVMVTSCMLPQGPSDGSGETEDGSNAAMGTSPVDGEKKGFFASLFGKLRNSSSPQERSSSPSRMSMRMSMSPQSKSSPVFGSSDRRSGQSSATGGSRSTSLLRGSMVNLSPTNPSVASHSSLGEPQAMQMRVSDSVPLNLVAWRPLNRETSISLGPNVVIYLREIHLVHIPSSSGPATPRVDDKGNLSPRGTARRGSTTTQGLSKSSSNQLSVVSDGIVQILLKSGHYCEFLVGTVITEKDDNGVDQAVEFLTDAAAAISLAERLNALAKHARQHYAFGRASMALHADLCPTVKPGGPSNRSAKQPLPLAPR